MSKARSIETMENVNTLFYKFLGIKDVDLKLRKLFKDEEEYVWPTESEVISNTINITVEPIKDDSIIEFTRWWIDFENQIILNKLNQSQVILELIHQSFPKKSQILDILNHTYTNLREMRKAVFKDLFNQVDVLIVMNELFRNLRGDFTNTSLYAFYEKLYSFIFFVRTLEYNTYKVDENCIFFMLVSFIPVDFYKVIKDRYPGMEEPTFDMLYKVFSASSFAHDDTIVDNSGSNVSVVRRNRPTSVGNISEQNKKNVTCWKCGVKGHTWRTCKHINERCANCNSVRHITELCKFKNIPAFGGFKKRIMKETSRSATNTIAKDLLSDRINKIIDFSSKIRDEIRKSNQKEEERYIKNEDLASIKDNEEEEPSLETRRIMGLHLDNDLENDLFRK